MIFNAETESGGIKPVLLNYGGAKKFVAEMSDKELQAAGESILRRAKEKAFSKGLPIYYVLEETLVAEYPNGRVVPVKV